MVRVTVVYSCMSIQKFVQIYSTVIILSHPFFLPLYPLQLLYLYSLRWNFQHISPHHAHLFWINFPISEKTFDCCLFGTCLFDIACSSLVSSIYWQVPQFHSFLWQSSNPFCIYTTYSLFIFC